MGAKQKRRISRLANINRQTLAVKLKMAERIRVLEDQARAALHECDRLRRLFDLDFVPSFKAGDEMMLTLRYSVPALQMMRCDPRELIAKEVYEAVDRSGILAKRKDHR